MKKLFKIGQEITKKQRLLIELLGFVFFLFIWWLITHPFVNPRIEFNAVNGTAPYSFQLADDEDNELSSGQGINTFSIPNDGKFTLKIEDGLKQTSSLVLDLSESQDGQKFNQIPENDDLGLEVDFNYRKPIVSKGILPAPGAVLTSFKELSKAKINLTVSQKYVLTENSVTSLKSDSLPQTILSELEPLLNQTFNKRDVFVEQIATKISPINLAKYEYDIVKSAQLTSVVSVSSLLSNTFYSVLLNIFGYIEAILVSIIVGFIIALVPFFRGLLSRYIDAIRFIPLAAVTGLFIAWFGIDLNMKVQFLAFGIFVFLLPVVVQRIYEVEKVYKQTAFTLGATDWQTIRYVYWPHVLSRLLDDVRVLTAISWTYIIVAETVNKDYGIGALIFTARRHSRLDHVFALLALIILIGFVQDMIFVRLDKKLNPHKY